MKRFLSRSVWAVLAVILCVGNVDAQFSRMRFRAGDAVTPPPPSGDSIDFTSKCQDSGILACYSFDSLSETRYKPTAGAPVRYVWFPGTSCDSAGLGTRYGLSAPYNSTSGNTFAYELAATGVCIHPTIDTSTKHSGDGALHMDYPSLSDSNAGGYFQLPIQGVDYGSPDNTWGPVELYQKSLWIQYYYRTADMDQTFGGSTTGYKQFILFPEQTTSSTTTSLVQLSNTLRHNLEATYTHVEVGFQPHEEDGLEPSTGTLYVQTGARCAYSGDGSGYLLPPCIRGHDDTWQEMTEQITFIPQIFDGVVSGTTLTSTAGAMTDDMIFTANTSVFTGGSGYSDAEHVAVTGGSGTGMEVHFVTSGGAIIGPPSGQEFVQNKGSGYLDGDVVTVTGGTGGTITLSIQGFSVYILNKGLFVVKSFVSSDEVELETAPGDDTDLTVYLSNVTGNSHTRMWVDGVLLDDFYPRLGWGLTGLENGYGTFTLNTQSTGKDVSIAHTPGQIWYDDLIISTNPIPFGSDPTYLQTQIAAMSAGDFVSLSTGMDGFLGLDGFGVGCPANALDSHGCNGITGNGDKMEYDPVQRRIIVMGSSHQEGKGLSIYDERTNAWWIGAYGCTDYPTPCPLAADYSYWTQGPLSIQPMHTAGSSTTSGALYDPVTGAAAPTHIFETAALDVVGRRYYYWFTAGGCTKSVGVLDLDLPYDVDYSWTVLPDMVVFGCGGTYGSLTFFPEMGSNGTLVMWGGGASGDAITGYDVGRGAWLPTSIYTKANSSGKYQNWMRYNAVKQVVEFGGGNNASASNGVYDSNWNHETGILHPDGSVTFADDNPHPSGTNSIATNLTVESVDPVTGIMNVFYGDPTSSVPSIVNQEWWTFDYTQPSMSQWVQLSPASPPPVWQTTAQSGVNYVLSAPMWGRGVQAFGKFLNSGSAYLILYKGQ